MVPRRRARIDTNQPEIVKALRKVGAEVTITSALGGGFPDIVVSHQGNWYMVEIKDGDKVPSAQKLTPEEAEWHSKQKAPVYVINNVDAALAMLNTNK
jgi:Holliday junction resolvase